MKPGTGLHPWALLRYLAKPGTGHTPSRSRPELWRPEDRLIPWFTLADVGQLRDDRMTVVHETTEHITAAGVANSAAVVHPAGTVLLSRTASIGYSAVMGRPMAVSQDFMTWTPGPLLRSRYLLYVLRASGSELKRLHAGSTHKTIYMPDLLGLRTPLPPLHVQDRVVAELDDELEAIARLRERLERLADLRAEASARRAVDSLATSDCTPRRLRYGLLGIDQGWSPQCHERPVEGDEWGVLKLGSVNFGRFRPSESKALPSEVTPRPALAVRAGDLIMSRANTRALVGSAAVVEECPPRLMLSDLLYRLRLDPTIWDARYVAWVLGSRIGRSQIEAEAAGSASSMPKISQSVIRNLRLPHRPVAAQRALVATLRQHQVEDHVLEERVDLMRVRLREYSVSTIPEKVTGRMPALVDDDAAGALVGTWSQ